MNPESALVSEVSIRPHVLAHGLPEVVDY